MNTLLYYQVCNPLVVSHTHLNTLFTRSDIGRPLRVKVCYSFEHIAIERIERTLSIVFLLTVIEILFFI
uniref:Uncharacterized protein n=1 Tax=Myoviridae sp. ctcyQ27 TaxID=2825139 RepID=A0A8S5UFI1_9CAUD|nr:MAG TPA: hypothetical protein [Myoviridae sp. ctcyQ27]